MKKLKLRISLEALSDLENIWLYTSIKWSIEQADKYYLQITHQIELLRIDPFLGKSAEQIRPDYRVSIIQSHIIFYKASLGKSIDVVRILHQSVDIDKWLE